MSTTAIICLMIAYLGTLMAVPLWIAELRPVKNKDKAE